MPNESTRRWQTAMKLLLANHRLEYDESRAKHRKFGDHEHAKNAARRDVIIAHNREFKEILTSIKMREGFASRDVQFKNRLLKGKRSWEVINKEIDFRAKAELKARHLKEYQQFLSYWTTRLGAGSQQARLIAIDNLVNHNIDEFFQLTDQFREQIQKLVTEIRQENDNGGPTHD